MSISLSENKKERIDEINRFVEMKSIERSNADLLIKLINNAETLDEVISIFQLGTVYKNTGFHYDIRLEPKNDNTVRYFKKNTQFSFVDKNNLSAKTHKMIIGDNYEALLNLLIEYKNKIDVIYIDPPYGKDNMGQFAITNYNNSITRDNLLSMLHPRLILAKQLLSSDGIICCSIDDKNYAYIKCLFDEIFGEKNFVESFINRSNPRGNQAKKLTASEHEYILCYAKNINEICPLGFIKDEIEFTSEDKNGKYSATGLRKRGAASTREEAPNQYYPIYYSPKTNEITIEEKEGYVKILPKLSSGKDGRWRWSKENVMANNNLLEAKLVKRNNSQEWDIFVKKYYTGEDIKKVRSIFYEKEVNNENATEELQTIFEDKVFSYPKPVYTIKKIVEVSSKKDSIILDFFAGSGTTGQAVLELNKEDNGNRKFILVQYPEDLDKNSKDVIVQNGIKLLNKYNLPLKISSITCERLRRVMTGLAFDGANDFQYAKSNTPLGDTLEVYDICKVANFCTEKGATAFDVIDETLYGQETFNTLKEKITWVCNNFDKTQEHLSPVGDENATRS